MPDKLPEGWVKTTLGEVCARVSTIRPEDSPNTEFTYFDIGGIDNQSNRIVETKTFVGREAPSRARQSVRKDDILFSTVRTYLRKIARIDQDYPNPVASTGFTIIRAVEGVSPQLLFSQVLSEDFLQPIHALQTGSSYPAVRDKDVFAQPIRLAPSREQERIVAKLDALLSRVAAGEAAARRALERLKRYRAAVLHAAVTGELTRDWRKTHKPDETGPQLLQRLLAERRARWEEAELKRLQAAGKPPKGDKWKKRYSEPALPKSDSLPELPGDWASASIDQLGWTSGYGTSVKCTYEAKGPAVLRIPNIRNRELDFTDLKFATSSKDISDEDYVAPGDLLLIRTNGSIDLIGRAAVAITAPQKKCSFASYLIRFRLVSDESLWSWASLTWGSDVLRLAIRSRAATTAGQYNVSLSGLADLPLPIPPLAEQEVIVREVERRLTAADRLSATLNRQLDRAQATRQSLLREAFAGKLVPQDPNDEPASALLERIHAAREAEAQKPKVKKERVTKLRAKRPPTKPKRPSSDGASEPPRVVIPVTLEDSAPSPRQVRLIRLKLYDDFNSLKAAEFPLRGIVGRPERLSPLCLVGLNGSGKSNLIEALSEIFCHVELSLLPWESITSKQREIPLRFDLEYQLVASPAAKPTTVRLENPGGGAVVFKIVGDDSEEVISDWAQCRALLPTRVLGYSSGLNETISIPYFRTAAVYSQEVLKQAQREKADPDKKLPDVPDSNTFFMDYECNALILVSNYLLQPRPRLGLFRRNLRIDSLNTFDIRFRNTYQGRKPVELTRELTGYLDALRSCATVVGQAADTEVFRFTNPKAAAAKLKSAFTTAGNLFRALYKLTLLNPLALSGKKRKFFLREEAKTGQLERPPTISREDRIFSVENIRVNLTNPKRPIDYAAISDGEHQFLQIFGSVTLFDEPGCVFLLDEPETHFNPHWRRLCIQWLADMKKTQRQELMISTHSPFVVSGCHKKHVFKFVRDGGHCVCSSVSDETFGASYDYLLARLFSMETMIAGEAIEEMKELVKSTDIEKLRQAIPRFGESLEKRFIFERIAQLEQNQKKGKKK